MRLSKHSLRLQRDKRKTFALKDLLKRVGTFQTSQSHLGERMSTLLHRYSIIVRSHPRHQKQSLGCQNRSGEIPWRKLRLNPHFRPLKLKDLYHSSSNFLVRICRGYQRPTE